MPDWIEPINKEKAKSAKQLPVIPLRWRTTTVPEIPIRLPIPAYLNVTAEGIQVHAERPEDPEFGESAEEMDVQFRKQDIVSIAIFLMPPIADGSDMRYVEITDYSRAVIRHRDPFEVVPYFESTFTCDNDYWLRALAKANKDRLKVKQTFFETRAAS
jgi:hypothetical protein